MEQSNRQKKIAGLIQKDLVDLLQADARNNMQGTIISVTKVLVTKDLGQAKVYLSVFPSGKRNEIIEGVQANTSKIRHQLSQKTKHQLRRMPELQFYGDDSLDYIESIEKSLNGEDTNPISNPDILDKRKNN